MVGNSAFWNCTKLTNVHLNMGLTTIGGEVFALCTSLESIALPPTVKVVGYGAFSSCTKLANADLNEGLENISRTFYGCTSLASIKIPSTVKVIDEGAFWNCTKLENVQLSDRLKVIGEEAFSCCTSSVKIELNEGLGSIGGWAFEGCTSLNSVLVPSTVKVIERYAFSGCSSLVNDHLNKGLETIERGAFYDCISMLHITIPSTVKEIQLEVEMNSRLFHGCTSLVKVDFCTEIQELMSGLSSSDWWNQDVYNKVWRTYMFLTQERIAERLRWCPFMEWRSAIHDMLKQIPSIDSLELQNYYDSINSKVTTYEKLKEMKAATTLLELALWKA